ncbi:MAG: Trk system potassium transport protein TrkA [Legionellales bacterium RIFCSPHIGHO2_12_FULL_35_11]|nr:MAG: Trk system potassium transport protein TrkA [Legionellales bacterium RIFCSPHIGHO2_12_FULL_35_11]
MRIIILGAGQVGGSLAQNLVNEDNDITLIDTDEQRLFELKHRLDIQTVHGSASHPKILLQAGIKQADMVIAVTNSDEVNMIGCFIAYNLFQTPSKIARIRSENYYEYPAIFENNAMPIDVRISPEQLVTEHIINLVDYPGTTQILDFYNGQILLMTIKINLDDGMHGKNIQQITRLLDSLDVKIVALFRRKVSIPVTNDCILIKNDSISFIASSEAIQPTLVVLGCYVEPNKRIIIAGGGNIGKRLAISLERRYQVKVIDHNSVSAAKLAAHLEKATVLEGDIADKDLLVNENIEFTDVFCAVTNDDEANIMACLQAKKLGVKYTMALVNKDAYVDLIDDSSIDYAISPQHITIGSILTKLRRGNMIKVHRLQHDEAEVIELIINGDEQTSRVIGRKIEEIEFPPGCMLAAVARDGEVFIIDSDFVLQEKDHVIILLLKKRYIRQLESLFQVNLSFMSLN